MIPLQWGASVRKVKMERVSMRDKARGEKSFLRDMIPAEYIRLLMGMALALLVIAVLIMAVDPGAERKDKTVLSHALLSEKAELNIDSQDLASRVLEQKFQIHMEEMDQQMGEIPYVEIWVLNDPFYPLMGVVANLRNTDGTLSNKQWQMLGFPDYEGEGTTTSAPAPSTPPSSVPVTTGVTQRVVIVEEIYEIRGIRYASIKVNDNTYDKLKAGSEFSEVFKIQEIRDGDTVIILCGDETYELEVDQLRKI